MQFMGSLETNLQKNHTRKRTSLNTPLFWDTLQQQPQGHWVIGMIKIILETSFVHRHLTEVSLDEGRGAGLMHIFGNGRLSVLHIL